MSIKLWGRGSNVDMHSSSWEAVQEIAREFGWIPEFKDRTDEETWPGPLCSWMMVQEDNARALAKALYRAIQEIETGSLSKRLVQLARRAELGNLRDVADFAIVGDFYVD
jgi:hypothetical protein